MSKAIDNEYIIMPEGASKFPITPGVTTEDLPKLRPSISPTPTDQGSTSTKRSRNRKAKAFNENRARFNGDLGCFVTGYTCLSLEPAHIVNAVRNPKDQNRLIEVIHILIKQLNIVRQPSRFTLESLENMFLLLPSYHRHLDIYATYAITLSKESLQDVITVLKDANKAWDAAIALPAPTAPRLLPWFGPALVNVKFDLILLHPALFLPCGQPLIALKTHEPRTYASWTVVDRELREQDSSSNSPPYPPFSYTHRPKTVFDQVNPLLLILNAGLKLMRHEKKYGFENLTDRQQELARLTLEAYELIYYRPVNFEVEPSPTAVPALPPFPLQIGAYQHLPSTSSQGYDNSAVALGGGTGNDQMMLDDMNEDDGSESDSEELSADEGYRILAKFDDPSTTLDERKELGALLLGGVRPYRPFPVVPGVELPEEPSLFRNGREGL